MGIPLGPNDWAIRCNLVNIDNEEMRDFTAGHIGNAEGKQLIEAVQKALGGPVREGEGAGGQLEFHAGVSYRNILVFRSQQPAPFAKDTKTQPPHDIPDRPIAGALPQGPGSGLLRDLMQRSRDIFRDHTVNKQRQAAGKRPATQIWLWGQGKARACGLPRRTVNKAPSSAPWTWCAARIIGVEANRCSWHRLSRHRVFGQGCYAIEALKTTISLCPRRSARRSLA